MRFSRGPVVGAAIVALALVASACGSSGDDDDAGQSASEAITVTVGSANFSESTTIANIYAKALEAKGHDVKTKFNIGSREVYLPALERGEIDLMPDYAATLLEAVNNNAGEATADAAATTTKLNERLAPKGLKALTPSPARDVNAFAVTKKTAQDRNLKKLSDLTPVAGELTLGGPPECPERRFCAKGLQDVYGLRFKAFRPVGLGPQANTALERGQVDVTTVLSTDGQALEEFVILEDDRQLQNADNIVPVIRNDKAPEEVVALLDEISAALTTEDLAALNKRTDVDKEDSSAVAEDWLREHDLL